MVSKLAPAILRLVVTSFAHVEVPTHRLSLNCLELETFEFFGNFCWRPFAQSRFFRRLISGIASMFTLTLGALWLGIWGTSRHSWQGNEVHIHSWVMHESDKNCVKRRRLVFFSNEAPTEFRRHDGKNFAVCTQDLGEAQARACDGGLMQKGSHQLIQPDLTWLP